MAFDFTGTMIKDEYEGFRAFVTKQNSYIDDVILTLTARIKRLENKATSHQMPNKLLASNDSSRKAPLPRNKGFLQKLLEAQDKFYDGPVEPFVKSSAQERDPQTKPLSNKIPIPLVKPSFDDAETAILVWKGMKQTTLPAIKVQRDNLDRYILQAQEAIEQARIKIILLRKFKRDLNKIDKLIQRQFSETQPKGRTLFGIQLKSLSSVSLSGFKKYQRELITKVHGKHLSILSEKNEGKQQIFPRSGYHKSYTMTVPSNGS